MSSTASRRGSWSASTPSATPRRPSRRASPSVPPSSPRWPCSPATSRPSPASSVSDTRRTTSASSGRRGVRSARRCGERHLPGRRDADQRRRREDLHRPAHRRLRRLPVLGPRHPGGGPHGRRRGAGGPQAVRRRQDHVGREAAGLRPGHRHLHRGIAARARHPRPARRAGAGHHRLRHRLPGPRWRSSPRSSSPDSSWPTT